MKNKKYKDSASRVQNGARTDSAEAQPVLERKLKDSGIPWIGMIPEDWSVEPIKHKYKIVAGSTPKSDNIENWDGNISWITPADYKTEQIYVYRGKRNLSQKGYESCSAILLPPGCLIFSKRAPIGLVAINSLELCTNQGCLGCIPNNDVNTKFVYYSTSIFSEQFELYGSGTTFKEISANNFANFRLALPPLPTQQRIADFLDRKCAEIDELAALQETMIAELKRYKQSVITEAVTKGLDPNVPMKDSGVEWIGKIPEEWEVGRMKNVCFQNPNSISEKENADYTFRYVDIGSVSFEKGIYKSEQYCFKDAPSRARRRANYGDFIMSTVRTYLKAIDVIDTDEKASFIYSTGFAVLTPFDNISFKFLSYMSKSSNFLEQVSILSKGINYPSINSVDLMTIHIVIPPLSEQQRIADYLDEKCAEIDELIAIKQQKIEALKEYKKSVIFEYVTGKKEVAI